MTVEVDIHKDFGAFRLDAAFSAGNETLALLGASGCGKSMTLKCIAGVVAPDRGRITVDGEVLFDSERRINVTPQQRRTGLMFQNYALFPQMTVLQNIRAGVRREPNRAAGQSRVAEIMERFGLSELASLRPAQLSGGQQQRVALARILVSDPRILLLDEPFSALDSHLRFRLEQQVREVIQSFGKTVILVSHDRDEVFRLADSIAVMGRGCIETAGPKHQVVAAPATRSGAILTGCKNISAARPLAGGRILAVDWGVELELPPGVEPRSCVGIRMHDLRCGGRVNAFSCRVCQVIENTFSYTVMLLPEGVSGRAAIGWELDKEQWRQLAGERLTVALPPESLLTFSE